MGALIGLDAKLYRGPAGAPATTEMLNVRNVKTPVEKGEANISRRGSRWELTKATLKKATIDFEMINDDTDADVQAIATAFFADTPLAFKVLDKASGHGLDADFEIMKFERAEDLEDAQIITVSIKPTYVGRWPAWV